MAGIDAKDYIDELLYCIKKKDMVKAKVLLQHFDKVEETAQRRFIFELGRSDEDFSLPLLASLMAENPDLSAKVPTLRQMLIRKFIDEPSALPKILDNPKTSNKRIFVEIAGEICSGQSVQSLINILKTDSDKDLIIAALNSLGEICSSEAANAITDFLYSRDKKTILAAIRALRKIASPVSIQRLAERMGTDSQMDLIILDVFAEVQDKTSLEKLNESLISHYALIRNYGKKKLVDVGPKAVPVLIGNLLYDDPDILIHTLNVLAAIGDKSAIGPVRKLLFNEPKDPNVRFAAYEALGMLPLDKGAYILSSGLADPVENVCMAAARAINRNYNDVLSTGIKNLISESGPGFQKIIRTIIDSEADNVFLDIIKDELSCKYAIAYLKNKAHKDLRGHFDALLRRKGFSELADKMQQDAGEEKSSPSSLKIYVVDDSRMILSVYRTILHKLEYESELFEFPAAALEKLKNVKPDILITDLNMPEITGIDLISQARKQYSRKELPIIMVTTQNEVQDNEAAYSAGVNVIMNKPFDENSLQKAIKSVLT